VLSLSFRKSFPILALNDFDCRIVLRCFICYLLFEKDGPGAKKLDASKG
jgi:hypothetical protein